MIALVMQTGAAVEAQIGVVLTQFLQRPANLIGVLAPTPPRGCAGRLRIAYRTSSQIIQSAPMAGDQRNSKAAALIYGILPSAAIPRIKRITHITEKRKTNNLAIAAAPAAMPLHPNSAAISAISKKMTAQRNINFTPRDESEQPFVLRGRSTANFALKYDSFV